MSQACEQICKVNVPLEIEEEDHVVTLAIASHQKEIQDQFRPGISSRPKITMQRCERGIAASQPRRSITKHQEHLPRLFNSVQACL